MIIIILFIFILFIFIISIYRNKYILKENFLKENFLNLINHVNYKYYRCYDKPLGSVIQKIFDKYNIKNSNNDWDIYIPCGYNNVEDELLNITIYDNPYKKYIFGINGCDYIVSKNEIWKALVECYGRFEASKLMPETYILDDPNEMLLFSKYFNTAANDIYILKKNIQRKEGLKLTRNYFDIINSVKEDFKVCQKYIKNLFLINGRKVNLRFYLLIIIKNNYIYFYVSNIGKCIYTNKIYNDDDLDFESNITSYNFDINIYNKNPRDFEELKMYINNYFQNNNKASKLFNKINILIKQVCMCLTNKIYQSNNIKGCTSFQLYGGDIIINNDLHPYLLEFNKGPDMEPKDKLDEILKENIQKDIFKTLGIIHDNQPNSYYLIYKSKIIKN
jgi:hypothetical protein